MCGKRWVVVKTTAAATGLQFSLSSAICWQLQVTGRSVGVGTFDTR